jgi:hypothetical protein
VLEVRRVLWKKTLENPKYLAGELEIYSSGAGKGFFF